MTQDNLGSALAILGSLESDPARLKEAVAAYREALKERTRGKVPFGWAMTQDNLGTALEMLGWLEWNPARLEEAARALEGALLVFRPAKADYYVQKAEKKLERFQKGIGQLKNVKSEVGEETRLICQRLEALILLDGAPPESLSKCRFLLAPSP